MKLLRKLLWEWGGFEARARRQKLREKLHWVIYQDQVNGWLATCAGLRNAPEVRV